MGNVEIPKWLKGLPLAPEFRPSDTEFADPIAYISKIEKEASAFGICKIIPPLAKPSKRYVFSNLNKSLSKCPELGDDVNLLNACSSSSRRDDGNNEETRAAFTTRQQELGQGVRRTKGVDKENLQLGVHKQVWQSGEIYTLEQFESKSRAFARSLLGMIKEVNPLVIEALFWKATLEKPIYVEYANDVPGSAFAEPEGHFQYFRRRRRKRASYQSYRRSRESPKKNEMDAVRNSHYDDVSGASVKKEPGMCLEMTPSSSMQPSNSLADENMNSSKQKSVTSSDDMEGTAGWKLSNSPWNLQVIARSPGSLTRFMPDDIPGVTSPMVYIGMLFSWFAWHVEDHELHSLNFLHTGSPKTWYAVPGDHVFAFEEVIRTEAYGGDIDRLAALSMLGEKTTLLSPEVIVSSGIPCCRLVQNPGEFIVTFPRAYHVGFSHGFNCGEAANFGTPQWLKVAKEAAVRRAAMNYLPMLSHQQLLYLLTMSFVSRVPRSLLPGARSSRLRDRQREERELSVKKAFLEDMLKENDILSAFLEKNSFCHVVIWNPDLLPCSSKDQLPSITSAITTAPKENSPHIHSNFNCNFSENDLYKETSLYVETLNDLYMEDDDLSSDFQVDSGTLPCVACGLLGFPFMSVVQPSDKASIELMAGDNLSVQEQPGVTRTDTAHPSSEPDSAAKGSILGDHTPVHDLSLPLKDLPVPTGWNTHSKFVRPRIFCLEHGLQIKELLQSEGGANMLLICHSDYQKIKAHASAISEEIEYPFSYTEVPLEAASQEDLNLIYLAIDDEDHHECGEDWTSKLAINLQYCVKIRKNSPSKKVQHALALGGLFTDKSPSSDFLNIKWQSRRSRSRIKSNKPAHCKPVRVIGTNRHALLGNKKHGVIVKKEEKLIQYTRRKFKVKIDYSTKGLQGRSRRCLVKEVPGASGDDPDKHTEKTSLVCHCNIGIPGSGYAGFGFSPIEDSEMLHEVQVLEADDLTLNSALSQVASSILSASMAVESFVGKTEDQLLEQSNSETNICNSEACGSSKMEHGINTSGGTIEKQDSSAPKCCWPFVTAANERSAMQREDQIVGNVNKNSGIQNMGFEGQHNVLDDDDVSIDEVSILAKPGSLYVSHPPMENLPVENFFINHEVGPSVTFDNEVQKELETRCGDQCSSNYGTLIDQPTISVDKRCGDAQQTCAVENEMQPETEIAYGRNSDEVILGNVISEPTLVPNGVSSEFHREPCAVINFCNGMAFKNGEQQVFQTPNDSNKELSSCSVTLVEIDGSTASVDSKLHTQDSTEKDLFTGSTLETVVPQQLPTTETRIVEELALNSATRKQELSEASGERGAVEDSYACKDSEPEAEQETYSSIEVPEDSEVQKIHPSASSINEDEPVSAHITLVNQLNHPVKKHSTIEEKRYPIKSMVKGNDVCLSQEIESVQSAVVGGRSTAGKGRKRKNEVEYTENKFNCNGFIRSPCEGLRPRIGKEVTYKTDRDGGKSIEENPVTKRVRKPDDFSAPCPKRKEMTKRYRYHKCDLEGCRMNFETKAELQLHKRNRCTYDGCGKKFSSHKYAIIHQRVHEDIRPLKCPWNGCSMSFKWAWARIEHIRVHTGEKPYQCKVEGCGLSFRFVSDFSRHRRKTGHYLNTPA